MQDPLTCTCSCKFTQLHCKSRQLELNERTCRFVYERFWWTKQLNAVPRFPPATVCFTLACRSFCGVCVCVCVFVLSCLSVLLCMLITCLFGVFVRFVRFCSYSLRIVCVHVGVIWLACALRAPLEFDLSSVLDIRMDVKIMKNSPVSLLELKGPIYCIILYSVLVPVNSNSKHLCGLMHQNRQWFYTEQCQDANHLNFYIINLDIIKTVSYKI